MPRGLDDMEKEEQPVFPSFSRRRNLREEIRDMLRGAVISGQLRPGIIYSAPSLAEQFGVSSTPVREAMLDLANEGHVEALRYRGFRITELSPAQLDSITDVRVLLEVPTVRAVVAAGADPSVIERLNGLADAIVEAAERQDLIGFITGDMDFHLAVLGLSGNEELVDVARLLRTKSRLYGLQSLTAGQIFASAKEHGELVRLLEARDADGAERLMRYHLGHVRGLWAGDMDHRSSKRAPRREGEPSTRA
jgi:DNA-binding GntR family transcriptional regulator